MIIPTGQEIYNFIGIAVPIGTILYQAYRYGRFRGKIETKLENIEKHQSNCCLAQRVEAVEMTIGGHIQYHEGLKNGIKDAYEAIRV